MYFVSLVFRIKYRVVFCEIVKIRYCCYCWFLFLFIINTTAAFCKRTRAMVNREMFKIDGFFVDRRPAYVFTTVGCIEVQLFFGEGGGEGGRGGYDIRK